MKQLFDEVLNVEGVKGLLLFDTLGAVLFKDFPLGDFENPANAPLWSSFVESLEGIQGFEMVYADGRIYIRRIRQGYLLILMDDLAPVAMIRLNCDVLLHGQEKAAKRKSTGFFRRRG